jgi:Flp pilus assembly secretin CpaC
MRRLQFLAIALALIGVDVAPGEEPASSDRFERLENKRAQLRVLQQEVAMLERELGVVGGYQVRCFIGEIPIDKLRQFDLQVTTSEGRIEKLVAAKPFGVSHVDSQRFQHFIDALKAAKAVKILAEPTLVVEPGQYAKMHSGGEFPVPLPTTGKETDVEWRNFGITMETKLVPIERNVVRLMISAEHSERDFDSAVKLNGQTVPGLRTSRIKTESQMELGQTLLVGMSMQNSVRFFAVTPSESAGSTPAP